MKNKLILILSLCSVLYIAGASVPVRAGSLSILGDKWSAATVNQKIGVAGVGFLLISSSRKKGAR